MLMKNIFIVSTGELVLRGGDLNIEKEKQKLLEYENNIERIIIVNYQGEKTNDITSILA